MFFSLIIYYFCIWFSKFASLYSVCSDHLIFTYTTSLFHLIAYRQHAIWECNRWLPLIAAEICIWRYCTVSRVPHTTQQHYNRHLFPSPLLYTLLTQRYSQQIIDDHLPTLLTVVDDTAVSPLFRLVVHADSLFLPSTTHHYIQQLINYPIQCFSFLQNSMCCCSDASCTWQA